MKTVYWRPQKISVQTLVVVGLLSVSGVTLLETLPVSRQQPDAVQKLAAAELASRCLRHLDEQVPTAQSKASEQRRRPRLLGSAMTPLTSRSADVEAKQRSLDPNFAAVVVEMLSEADVQRGDLVAVGWSGSFPGLNVAVASALQTIGAEPLVVSSVMASQYGANRPEFTWLDMERTLREHCLLSISSLAATIGGPADRGRGMSQEARQMARAAMARNGIDELPARRISDSIDMRWQQYNTVADGRPISAYINVGGGIASCGGTEGKQQFRQGVNRSVAPNVEVSTDCVMLRFLKVGVPAIQLTDTEQLARQYSLASHEASVPVVGQGALYAAVGPSRWGATLLLMVVLGTMHGLVRSGLLSPAVGLTKLFGRRRLIGPRLWKPEDPPAAEGNLELMV